MKAGSWKTIEEAYDDLTFKVGSQRAAFASQRKSDSKSVFNKQLLFYDTAIHSNGLRIK